MFSIRTILILVAATLLPFGAIEAQKPKPKKSGGSKKIGKLIWHDDVAKLVKKDSSKVGGRQASRSKNKSDQKLILWLRLLGELEGKS